MSDPLDRLVAAIKGASHEAPVDFLAAATELGLAGIVARHAGVGPPPEHRVARRLREQLMRETARDVSAALAGLGIVHFFARGAALGPPVYELGDRDMADIDLYVGPESTQQAIGVLERMGFAVLPDAEQSGPVQLRSGLALARPPGPGTPGIDDVHVDLHWGIDPVDRLLPRADLPVPARVWSRLERAAGLPVPAPAHHAALIAHHLVHHDFLHLRGLVDLVRLRQTRWTSDGVEYERLAAELGVLRAARVVHAILVSQLGLDGVHGVAAPDTGLRTRRLSERLRLTTWVGTVLRADRRQLAAITPRRVLLRAQALDHTALVLHLLRDGVFPPRAHLAWRWPAARSALHAWWLHLSHTVRRAMA